MPTSGVRTITKTAGELIRRSFMTINQHEPTASFPADMSEDALEDLNSILAMWQAEGIGIWKQRFMTLYLQKGTSSYLIGPSGDNATYTSIETTIGPVAAVVPGATISFGSIILTVLSTSGMSAGDYITIMLDDGSLQWTTIVDVFSTTQLQLATALTDSASFSNAVTAYSTVAATTIKTPTSLFGAVIINVTSATGMTNGDKIGIQLNNGSLQFTTIFSVLSPTQLQLSVALTDGVALGNAVFTYTTTSSTTVGTAAAVVGAIVINVASTAGMTAADYIGVQLDDGTLQWTTITAVLSATQLQIAVALTDSAAAGNVVYTYTTKADRPVELAKMVRRSSDGTDQDLWELSRVDYLNTTQKTNAGPVIQWYYDQQMTNGVLYVWETPDDVTDRLIASVRQPFELTVDLVDDIEMPFEWYRVLKWELAAEIATEYGVSLQTIAYMEQKAETLKAKMSAYDMDKGSFYFQPDSSR